MLFKRSGWAMSASSALVNLVACTLVLALLLLGQQGFGTGDTGAFLCWTVPLALAIAAGRRTWDALFGSSRPAVRVLAILVVAAALAGGYGWCTWRWGGCCMRSAFLLSTCGWPVVVRSLSS